jgi:MFS family permease
MGTISRAIQKYGHETFSSLYVRNYRLYYIGQIISTSGTFMQSVAQAWLVLKLTNSGAALGIVSALQYVPILVLGPYGGVIADRFSKRKILYLTQSLSGILALILGALTITGLVRVWMVDVLAFLLGIVTVFDNPARQTFYVELVGQENVRNAVTLYSSLVNLARIIGPAIAAAVIAVFGLGPCFIINGISYAAVVIMLAMMRAEELLVTPPAPRGKGQIQEGFKYVASTSVLASTLII